jgi:hypothetical protein
MEVRKKQDSCRLSTLPSTGSKGGLDGKILLTLPVPKLPDFP